VWTQEHQTAFEEVKARLVADPVLACPDFDKPFILQTDASDYGIGAILTQETERGEKVISYSSRTLNGAEKNYSTTEKECLAIIWAIRKLKPYLEGYHFKVVTNHMALKWPEDNSTSGSPVLLARNAQRRPSPRARMRDMHEIQAQSDANDWENAVAGVRGTMGYGMCGLRRTPAAFETRQTNAAGIDRPVLQVD